MFYQVIILLVLLLFDSLVNHINFQKFFMTEPITNKHVSGSEAALKLIHSYRAYMLKNFPGEDPRP